MALGTLNAFELRMHAALKNILHIFTQAHVLSLELLTNNNLNLLIEFFDTKTDDDVVVIMRIAKVFFTFKHERKEALKIAVMRKQRKYAAKQENGQKIAFY